MQLPGYWVSNAESTIEVSVGKFDDTDLSDVSNWTEAWQNEEGDSPHGFLDPLTMLQNVSHKIVGQMSANEIDEARTAFRNGIPCTVSDLESLARLIQILVPLRLLETSHSQDVQSTTINI